MIPLRLVLDTNVVVSAALNPDGLQRTVVLLAMTKPAHWYVPPAILAEYALVIAGTFQSSGRTQRSLARVSSSRLWHLICCPEQIVLSSKANSLLRGFEAALQRLEVAERSINCLPLFEIVALSVQFVQSLTHRELRRSLVEAGLDEATADADVRALHQGRVLVLVQTGALSPEDLATALDG